MPSFPGIARVDLSVTHMNAAPKACPERIEGRQHFDDRVGRSQSVWPHEPTVLRAGGPGPSCDPIRGQKSSSGAPQRAKAQPRCCR